MKRFFLKHQSIPQGRQFVLQMLLMLYNTSFLKPWARRGQGGKHFALNQDGGYSEIRLVIKPNTNNTWTCEQRLRFKESKTWVVLGLLWAFVSDVAEIDVMYDAQFEKLRKLFGCFSEMAGFQPLPNNEYEWSPTHVAPSMENMKDDEDPKTRWNEWSAGAPRRMQITEKAFRVLGPELLMIHKAFANVFQSEKKLPIFADMYKSKWSKL